MYSRNSFGSFYPVDSSIHRLNPVVKLILFLIAVFLVIASKSLYIHLFLLSLVIVMILLSYVPIKYYFKTFWFFRYIYLIIVFASAYFGNTLELTCIYLLKLIIIVEYLNILAFTTSPSETIYSVEKVITPFNILFLRVSKIAFKINNLLRYIPRMQNTEYKILKAQSSRGIDYNHSTVFGRFYALNKIYSNMFKLTRRKNAEISFSGKLRLYDVKMYRTNYRTNKVGFYDIVFMLFHLLLIYAYINDVGLI